MADGKKELILVDGREFIRGRRTGIGRFLEGLLLAVAELHPQWQLRLLLTPDCRLPDALAGRVEALRIEAAGDTMFGWHCARMSGSVSLFLSPYPKLPLFRMRCPMIHTVHDVLYLTHEVYRGSRLQCALDRLRLRLALKKADLTWFDSGQSRDECEALFGRSGLSKIRYPAIEPLFTERAGGPSGRRHFLYVGNALPHKNIDIILQALETMDARLKCVGVKPDSAAELFAKHPGVSDRVVYLQDVDDAQLLELYRSAYALLLPSSAEGYGYPPLEAMACGTPAIVSDIPVLRETTGGFAMYCHPDDVRGWQSAMQQLQQGIHDDMLGEPVATWLAGRQGVAGWQQHLRDMELLMQANVRPGVEEVASE